MSFIGQTFMEYLLCAKRAWVTEGKRVMGKGLTASEVDFLLPRHRTKAPLSIRDLLLLHWRPHSVARLQTRAGT